MTDYRATVKTCFAMGGIIALEIYALSQGIDGVALGTVIATLAGIGGFAVGAAVKKSE